MNGKKSYHGPSVEPPPVIRRRPSRLILTLLLTAVLLSGAAATSSAQAADELLYGQGVDLYQEKRYDEALELFETLRSSYPESRKDDDALYYIGRIHRRQDRPEQAAEFFFRFYPFRLPTGGWKRATSLV